MKGVVTFAVAGVALHLAACAAPSGASAPPVPAVPVLENTRWVMAGSKADGSQPRLEFTREGRVAGFTGCNMMGGSYRLEGDRLEVAAATTKRACLGPGGEAEQRLLAVLADRPRASLKSGRLVLTDTQGRTFELEPAP